jgi:hypothetical protein
MIHSRKKRHSRDALLLSRDRSRTHSCGSNEPTRVVKARWWVSTRDLRWNTDPSTALGCGQAPWMPDTEVLSFGGVYSGLAPAPCPNTDNRGRGWDRVCYPDPRIPLLPHHFHQILRRAIPSSMATGSNRGWVPGTAGIARVS